MQSPSVGCWVLGVGWPLGVGCWVLGGLWVLGAPGRRRGHFTGTSMARLEAPTEHIRAMWSPSLYVPRRDSYCRALGVWVLGVGCWVLGVGCEAGSPRGPAIERALGRSPAACFAPPWLVHLPPTSPPPPPKGRGREPRAAAYPLNTPPGPNAVPTPSI